ncbi:MAG: hypothetical protein ACRDQC_15375, partial [Gaiellales bacterium]
DFRASEVIDRRDGVNGGLVLRRAGANHEVIVNGTFLMDTRDGRSERALVREAVAGLREPGCCSVLGVGGAYAPACARRRRPRRPARQPRRRRPR